MYVYERILFFKNATNIFPRRASISVLIYIKLRAELGSNAEGFVLWKMYAYDTPNGMLRRGNLIF